MRSCAADHPDAESAVTGYRTLAAGDGAALVELRPHTGRMHQLRVHLASHRPADRRRRPLRRRADAGRRGRSRG